MAKAIAVLTVIVLVLIVVFHERSSSVRAAALNADPSTESFRICESVIHSIGARASVDVHGPVVLNPVALNPVVLNLSVHPAVHAPPTRARDHLPEMIGFISGFLGLNDHANIQMVCKHWNSTANRLRNPRHFSISCRRPFADQIILEAVRSRLFCGMTHISFVNINFTTHSLSPFIQQMFKQFLNVEYLCVNRCKITCAFWKEIQSLNKLKKLELLNLTHWPTAADDSLFRIFDVQGSIKQLNLSGSTILNWSGARHSFYVSLDHAHSLARVDLSELQHKCKSAKAYLSSKSFQCIRDNDAANTQSHNRVLDVFSWEK